MSQYLCQVITFIMSYLSILRTETVCFSINLSNPLLPKWDSFCVMDNQVHPLIHQDISTLSFTHTYTPTHSFLSLLACATSWLLCREWRRRTDMQARDCARGAAPTPHTERWRDEERVKWVRGREKKKEEWTATDTHSDSASKMLENSW